MRGCLPSDKLVGMTSFILSTGKKVDPNRGVIGLGPAPEFALCEGYDGDLTKFEDAIEWDPDTLPDSPYCFTQPEQLEICEIMLARWQAYKTFLLSSI